MIDNKKPLVSIVMPNYNGAAFLEESIRSVLSQTYIDWELIIVDDFSTDNSLEIIKSLKDKRIKGPIELKTNEGAAVARNRGILESKGKYIAFLDNDDVWKKNKLANQINYMIEKGYTFTYTDYIQFSEEGKKTIKCIKKVNYQDLLKNNYILTSTVIYDAGILGKTYMENIRKRQDWSLFINIIQKSKKAFCLPSPLTYYRKHKNSLSASKIDLIKHNFDFYRKALGFSVVYSSFLMVRFVFYYFLKKIKERFGWYHG